MCVAVAGKIIEIVNEHEAYVDFQGIYKKVNIDFVNPIDINRYVLVHVGCAIEEINEEEALKNIEIFQQLLKKVEKVED